MPFPHASFTRFHQEISELADYAGRMADVVHREGLSLRNGDAFRKHKQEFVDQRFKTVLIAPFQSGKSTIFNTFVGGREVSPTGIGTKTSACAIEAHYIEAGDEHAVLEWRTNADLIRGFPPAILSGIQRISTHVPDTLEAVAEMYSLDNPSDRKLLTQCLLTAKKDAGRELSVSELERFLISLLILKHYPALCDRRLKRQAPLDAAKVLLTYPEDWGGEHSDPDRYSPDQVAFLFLKRVRLHLRVAGLRNLRTVLVDCPGRGASPVDNEIASQCVENADAIIFLLGIGGRVIDMAQQDELEWLVNQRQINPERIFVAYNARASKRVITERHLPVDLKNLNHWFRPPLVADDLQVFHALLALRLTQFLNLSTLTRDTLRALRERYRKELGGDDPGDDLALARKMIEWDIESQHRQFLGRPLDKLSAALSSRANYAGWTGPGRGDRSAEWTGPEHACCIAVLCGPADHKPFEQSFGNPPQRN